MNHNESGAVRVLLVDDYPAMAELMAEGLEAEDDRFAVDTVTSVEDALTRLEEAEYECLISDYEMPTMTGIEFLDIINERYPDLPFILVTAKGSEEVASDAISAGVTDYFRKEFGEVRETMLANRIWNAVERRRARRGRQAMRERMELALEATDSVVFDVDFETDTVRRHGGFEAFFGLASEEVPTPEAYANRVVHPSDRDAFLDFFSRLRHGDRASDTCEYRTHPDLGDVRWIRARARLHESDGTTRALGIAQDITDQKERIRDLELAEMVVEQTQDAIFLVDVVDGEQFRIERVNPAYEEKTGLDTASLRGRSPRDVFGKDAGSDIAARYRECIEKQEPMKYEEIIPIEEETRYWRTHLAPVVENGEVVKLVGATRDVTERRARERRYNAIFNQTYQFTGLLEPDGTVVEANETALEFGGLERETVVGTKIWETGWFQHSQETRESAREAVERAANGEFVRHELPIQGTDREVIIDFSVRPVTNDRGEVTLLIPEGRDITERKERERELRRLSQEYQVVFENAQDSLFLVDVDRSEPDRDPTFRFRHLNPANREALGLEEGELQGKTPRDVFGEKLGSEVRANYARCLDAGETISYEEEIPPIGASETRVFETTLSPVEIEGKQSQIVGVAHDITERKERIEKLQWYEGIVETTRDTAAVLDEDGRFKIVNNRLAEVYGRSADQLRGERSRLFAALADRYESTNPYRELVEGSREEFRTEIDVDYPSGRDWVSDIQMTRLSDSGSFQGVVAVGRDISERLEYERRLAALNKSTNEFVQATTTAEATEYIVDAMADAAGLPNAAVYIYDEDRGVLTPAAHSEDAARLIGSPPSIGPGEGVAWRVFASGEIARYDDIREAGDVYNPQTPIRSELIVPLGEHGVLVAGDPQPGVFDDRNQELAEIIGAAAEVALDSVTQTERLRERTRELDRQTRRLDRVNQLNDAIRQINRAIVGADSREVIVETVCERMAELDHVEFAWIGEASPDQGTLSVWTWGGTDRSYLDMRDFPIDEKTGSEPARSAVQTGDTAHVPNIVRADDAGQWQTAALQQGYKCVLSVPLAYDDSLYGVLTIYAGTQDVFDESFREVLAELGDLIGLGLNALDRRDALLDRRQRTVELEFAAETADPFLQLTDRLDCTVEVSRILPRDQETLVYAACTDVTEREVAETVGRLSGIESVRRVRGTDPCESDPCLFEFLAPEPGLVSHLADHGVRSHTMTFDRGRARIVATVPTTVDPSALVQGLETQWSDLTLEATKIQREQMDVSNAIVMTDELTAAQEEAIEAAYEAGFFEWPRDSTSEEVATALGISQPAFAQRLRAAQAKVFDAYCRRTAAKRT